MEKDDGLALLLEVRNSESRIIEHAHDLMIFWELNA